MAVSKKLNTVVIDKAVPLVERGQMLHLPLLNKMAVGDSVVLTNGEYQGIRRVALANKFKIASRRESPGKLRVWLVAKPAKK